MMWSTLWGILWSILASWQSSIVFTPDSDFEIAAFLFQRWQLEPAIRWPRYEVKEDLVKEVDKMVDDLVKKVVDDLVKKVVDDLIEEVVDDLVKKVVDDLVENVVEASTPSLQWHVCLQWEEERPGHSKPARSPLGSDHLEHHLATIRAHVELGTKERRLSGAVRQRSHWQRGGARGGGPVLWRYWCWVSLPP